jgi:hypothetical protein
MLVDDLAEDSLDALLSKVHEYFVIADDVAYVPQ